MFVSLISIIIAHCSLLFNFLQTYTYIVRDGQRRRDAGRNKMELQRRRLSAVQTAEREGNLIQKWRLSAAGCPYVGETICKPCDPLRTDDKANQIQQTQNGGEEEGIENEENYEAKDKDDVINADTIDVGECATNAATCTNGVNEEEQSGDDKRDIEIPPLQAAINERKKNQERFEKMNDDATSTEPSQEERKLEEEDDIEAAYGRLTPSLPKSNGEKSLEFVGAS